MIIRSLAVTAALVFGAHDALAQTPKHGGTLVFAVSAEPPNYDCHAQTSFAFLHPVRPHYSTLLKFDTANYPKVVGDLAESWTVAPDGLTYTFKLRRNVKFHDGTPMTSEDVKATYDRICKPPSGISIPRSSLFTTVSEITAPDKKTVVFKLSEPRPASFMMAAFGSGIERRFVSFAVNPLDNNVARSSSQFAWT